MQRLDFYVTMEDLKDQKHIKNDTDLTLEDLKTLVKKFKSQVRESTGHTFPTDPFEQLWGLSRRCFAVGTRRVR